jgi:hypothetical protein
LALHERENLISYAPVLIVQAMALLVAVVAACRSYALRNRLTRVARSTVLLDCAGFAAIWVWRLSAGVLP